MKQEPTGIIIQTAGLKDGIYEYSFDPPASEVRLPENFRDTVHVSVRMEKLRQRYIVAVSASTRGHYPCDRCLDDVSVPAEAAFEIFCTTDANEIRQIGEDEEVKPLDPNDNRIDLTEEVREFLLLNLPLRKICGEAPDGTPLCRDFVMPAEPEKETGEDPRWEGLKNIRIDEEKEK